MAATEEADSHEWIIELEAAIVAGCDFATLRAIAKNRPLPDTVRPLSWQILLGVVGKPDVFGSWDGLYNCNEQALIRAECERIVETLGNPNSDHLSLTSDLESIITVYSKMRHIPFEKDNGWSDCLQLLLVLNLQRAQLYNVFYAVSTKYIPRDCIKDGRPFDLFRLLLQYHDPQLCSLLDTNRVTPDMYAKRWFNSLFASTCSLPVALRMWDCYLQQADPFLNFFLALVILVNAKEQIILLKNDGNDRIAEAITQLPCQLEIDDIEDFCQLALFYASKTPQSFRRDYHGPLFGSNLEEQSFENVSVHSLLCLPVSVSELVHANKLAVPEDDKAVRYFVVDTRPPEQYAHGHLPGSYNLDAGLLVNSPPEFHLALQSLCAFQQKTHPNDHMCFMGSGREEEDKYLHMVISCVLQRGIPYVSYARGGYASLHELLRESLSTSLKSHSVKGCIVCNPPAPSLQDSDESPRHKSISLFSKVTSAVVSKSAVLKDKVVDYIVNTSAQDSASEAVKHAHPADRHGGKPYRNMPNVFSIAGDSGSDEELPQPVDSDDGHDVKIPTVREKVKVSAYVNRPEVLGVFECHQVTEKGELFSSHLVITKAHLIVLRDIENEKNWAFLQLKRSLGSVVKITSKKRYPELITFKYGFGHGDQMKIKGLDRFVIPKAGDAVKIVKSAAVDLHNQRNGD